MVVHRVVMAILLGLGTSTLGYAYTVRAPLVGVAYAPVGQEGAASWFTETRIINRGPAEAHVVVTDFIGYGTPLRPTFSVAAGGVKDMPWQLFSDLKTFASLAFFGQFEFTSDQPISVYTTVTTYSLADPRCPGSLLPLPPPGVFPYWGGGCSPMAGPLVRGFTDYLLPNHDYLMPWLVAENTVFRCNLYLTNPGSLPLTVVGTFRSWDATVRVTKTFTVTPHSQLVVPRVFDDPRFRTFPDTLEQAATATFNADGEFYVLAAVANNMNQGGDSINRFAIVQPEDPKE
jgi:hypothetical protein